MSLCRLHLLHLPFWDKAPSLLLLVVAMSLLEVVRLDPGVSVEDVLFWTSCVAAAPIWGSAILFPKARVTRSAWSHPMLLALPFTLGFTALVLMRLEWWLTRFVTVQLSLQYLTDSFSDRQAFLLLWFYILGFDVAVYGWIYKRLAARNASALEYAVWGLAGALCAPLALCCYTALDYGAPPLQSSDLDDKQEREEAQRAYRTSKASSQSPSSSSSSSTKAETKKAQ